MRELLLGTRGEKKPDEVPKNATTSSPCSSLRYPYPEPTLFLLGVLSILFQPLRRISGANSWRTTILPPL